MNHNTYPVPTEEEFRACTSETAKYRHLTAGYCTGCGVDVASQGIGVVPHAMQFDLPEKEFLHYSSGNPPASPIPLRGHADKLPFTDNSLDFVYSSHLLEDYAENDWNRVLNEWLRVLKPGGHLIIMVPDRTLWNDAIKFRSQPPNCAHRRESFVGDLTQWLQPKGVQVIRDDLTNVVEFDYNILFVGKKL